MEELAEGWSSRAGRNGFGAAGVSEQCVYAVDSDGRGAVSLKHGKQRFDGKSVALAIME